MHISKPSNSSKVKHDLSTLLSFGKEGAGESSEREGLFIIIVAVQFVVQVFESKFQKSKLC